KEDISLSVDICKASIHGVSAQVQRERDGRKRILRRCKNNEAAKRSRDARRLKENQISVRAAFLERENAALRQEVSDMRKELGRCRNILNKYESHHDSFLLKVGISCLQRTHLFIGI
uniref:BZIP domain-containing protein n=1 Tax=Cyprinus carpio TaxID=7962 RepID=A0A8C1GWN5_CYPCA